MNKYFTAVEHRSFHSAGELVAALELMITALFPKNRIEYWSDNRYCGPGYLSSAAPLPRLDQIDHVAAHVRRGTCGGPRIEVLFYLSDRTTLTLTVIKSRGSADEAWDIAHCLTEALESIFFYDEAPALMRMAEQIPRSAWFDGASSFTEEVEIHVGVDDLLVRSGRLILDQQSWSDMGLNAHFMVEVYLKDWELLLAKVNVPYIVSRPKEVEISGLPGYRFVRQGGEQVESYQVIAHKEDSPGPMSLGTFTKLSKAIIHAVLDQKNYELTPVKT